jgi:hypothetical protein
VRQIGVLPRRTRLREFLAEYAAGDLPEKE